MKMNSNEVGTCPHCGSDDLVYESMVYEGDSLYYPFKCQECDLEGEEWYSLEFQGHNVKTINGSEEVVVGEEVTLDE